MSTSKHFTGVQARQSFVEGHAHGFTFVVKYVKLKILYTDFLWGCF